MLLQQAQAILMKEVAIHMGHALGEKRDVQHVNHQKKIQDGHVEVYQNQ